MMRYIRTLLPLALCLVLLCGFSLKKNYRDKPVYAFGVAASFNDTVAYYTPIQLLDSVRLDKNGFLPEREQYSYQLKNHLEHRMQKPDYTCMIYFSIDKAKLQKEADKMKAKYLKKQGLTVVLLEPEAFKFTKPQQ